MSLCYDFQKWILVSLALVTLSLTVGLLMQYAHGQPCSYKDINGVCTEVANNYFSINVPDSWTYRESFKGPQLTPSEFSDLLLIPENEKRPENLLDGGAWATFIQDTDYPIKNAPLESYVKYLINKLGIANITSQHYTTVGKGKAVRIDANATNVKEKANSGYVYTTLYIIMHDKQPYGIEYQADAKNYEKYLPEFEQMVKSFKFVGSSSSESNENLTNIKTNFSGANLSGLSTNNKNQEELYNECVNVAGKSLCDFLFKR